MHLRAGRRHRQASASYLLFLLAGCATIPPTDEPRPAGARVIEGRISVRYKDLGNGKEDALSGRFVWTRHAPSGGARSATAHDSQGGANDSASIELSLLDPLGQTLALIRSDAIHASITFRNGRTVEGASPEALTQDTLGWAVPLHGLGSWLEGRPAAASAAVTRDDGGLQQDGWTIRFVREDHKDGAAGKLPPKRIDLFYPGPPAEIEMRLVIDQRSGA